MSAGHESIWEHARSRGHSRRDFLRFCGCAATAAGLDGTGFAQVVKAFDTKPRLPVVWLHLQECTCCSESFLRASSPMVADLLLDVISLDYSETLQAAAGASAEKALAETMRTNRGEYLLLVEGSVPTAHGGVYCCIGGRTALDIVREAASGAKAIVAWGNCATSGCVQAAKPAPTGATPVRELVTDKPVVNVPGCPPIGNVMAGTVVHLVSFDALPPLDSEGRPTAYYSRVVHEACPRVSHYEAGRFAWSFGDENAKNGYCLHKLGCRGPETFNSCSILKWNGGVSSDFQAGHGCIGCSQAGFWDMGPFYERQATLFGADARSVAATVGLVVGAGAVVGLAGRAATSRLRARAEEAGTGGASATTTAGKGE